MYRVKYGESFNSYSIELAMRKNQINDDFDKNNICELPITITDEDKHVGYKKSRTVILDSDGKDIFNEDNEEDVNFESIPDQLETNRNLMKKNLSLSPKKDVKFMKEKRKSKSIRIDTKFKSFKRKSAVPGKTNQTGLDLRNKRMPKEENDEFKEEQKEPNDYLKSIFEYMSESSLFIFHHSSTIRLFVIKLTVSKKEAKDKRKKDLGNTLLKRL
jgi:hypothetical protein